MTTLHTTPTLAQARKGISVAITFLQISFEQNDLLRIAAFAAVCAEYLSVISVKSTDAKQRAWGDALEATIAREMLHLLMGGKVTEFCGYLGAPRIMLNRSESQPNHFFTGSPKRNAWGE